MWVFGYGSLMWKVEFTYTRKVVGYVKGYVRRFYQGSEDHRGVPGKPGRVVTLVPASDPEESVWGVAYEIPDEECEKTMNYLDYREKDGYDKKTVLFYPFKSDLIPFKITIYVGHKTNPFFLGPASLEDMAKQICNAVGPSGPNKEYIYNLANSMRELAPHVKDDHLFQLEMEVRKLDVRSVLESKTGSSSDIPLSCFNSVSQPRNSDTSPSSQHDDSDLRLCDRNKSVQEEGRKSSLA